jgi:hypothetical protein
MIVVSIVTRWIAIVPSVGRNFVVRATFGPVVPALIVVLLVGAPVLSNHACRPAPAAVTLVKRRRSGGRVLVHCELQDPPER